MIVSRLELISKHTAPCRGAFGEEEERDTFVLSLTLDSHSVDPIDCILSDGEHLLGLDVLSEFDLHLRDSEFMHLSALSL